MKKLKATSMTPEELKKLQAGLTKAKEGKNFWNPKKEGERVFGKILSITKVSNKKGSKTITSKMVALESLEGETRFYLKTVLEKRFTELSIKVGDKIGIEYLGAKKSGKKIQYHKYAVTKL